MRSRLLLAAALAALLAPGRAFAWTDTLTAGATPIRKVHVDELRTAIAAKMAAFGFPAPTWTDPTITAGATLIRAVHMTEMNFNLYSISTYYRAVCPVIVPAVPAFNVIAAGTTMIRAYDFDLLRTYHDALGNADTLRHVQRTRRHRGLPEPGVRHPRHGVHGV